MRRITSADLEELAELREKAARVCEETKRLIEESRWSRKRADEFRQRVMPLTFPSVLTYRMLPRSDPRCRLILTHLKRAPGSLDRTPDTPSGDKGAREGGVPEVGGHPLA